MQRFTLCLLVLGLSIVGCSSSDSSGTAGTGGAGGTIGDLEWPPDATVYFDEHRIFNADCATDEDCAMALGYYHAFDRFVQMDVRRRFSTGRLADILLPGVAAGFVDDFVSIRSTFLTQDGRMLEDATFEHASDKTKALFEAYSAGVNRWITDVQEGKEGVVFPREFSHPFLDYHPEDVPPWTPLDCVASIVALVDELTNDSSDEINAGLARAMIDNDLKFSDLWSRRPLEESAILGPVGSGSAALSRPPVQIPPMLRRAPSHDAHALAELSDKLERIDDLRRMILGTGSRGAKPGSNNWVLDGTRTSSGNALLSNDPHLGMSQPAIWYLAHLDAKTNGAGDFHSAGVSFAGLPWVLIGQNESIAWGFTTTNMDFTDVYEEEVVDGTGVRFKGEVVPIQLIPWTMVFSDGTTQERDLPLVPHHGPVLQMEGDTALTLRWTGHALSTDVNFLTKLNAASNLEEARVALADMTSVGQNVVVADTAGAIGWFPYNQLPKRTWATNLDGDAPPWVPIDGEGDYEWTEYFTLEELPQSVSPESGYIATANNDMTGALFDGDPTNEGPPLQVSAAAGFRHKRIVDQLDAGGNSHTVATMDALISDVYSLIGERMRQPIMDIIEHEDTPDLSLDARKVVMALQRWNYGCPTGLAGPYTDSGLATTDSAVLTESSGCTAFHALLNELRFQIEQNEHAEIEFKDQARGISFAAYYSIVDPTQLVAGDIYWDNPATEVPETKYEVMARALNDVGTRLDQDYDLGPDETKWAWGRLHGLFLESDLGSFLGPDFDNPAPGDPLFANGGGLYTVDVAAPNPMPDPPGEFLQTWGASMRFVCEVSAEGPRCTIQLPGGQSGHVESENYEDLLFKYLQDEPMPLVFDIDEAAANAEEPITFE